MLPSNWATVDVSYGEKKAHLWAQDKESFEFHATEADARKAVEEGLRSGVKMVALLKVESVYRAKRVEVEMVDGPMSAKIGSEAGY